MSELPAPVSASPYLLLVHAQADADEADTIAHIIRRTGRRVQFFVQDEDAPLGPRPDASEEGPAIALVRDAACVLMTWSSQSAGAPPLLDLAEAAARQGRLLVVRLDAAPPPGLEAPVVEIGGGAGRMSERQVQALLNAVTDVAGPVPAPATGPKPAEQRKRPKWIALAAGGLCLALIAGLGAVAATSRIGASAASRMHPADAPEALAAALARSDQETASLQAWGATSRTEPLALRQFLERYPASSQAEAARTALLRLDHEAWDRVAAADGAERVFQALSAYRLDFPEGAHIAAAAAAEARAHDLVEEIQTLLGALGFKPGAADGVSRPETQQAVEAYQASVGLPQTGVLDAALLEGLRARRPGPKPRQATSSPAAPAAGVTAASPASSGSKLEGSLPTAEAGKPFRDCYLCPELIPLPQGSFEMGDASGRGDGDEKPAHRVAIAYRLAVGRTEVTFEEWDACVAEGGCTYKPADMGWGRGARPVVNIGSDDVGPFLAWLQHKTGKRYRLLSEAEWEYAARAGSLAAYAFGDDRSQLCRHGNGADQSTDYSWRNPSCSDGYAKTTAPAASFAPNRWGLHDMLGNIWEWTADCWHEGYQGAPTDGSAWVQGCSKPEHVLRGGAYSVDPEKLRSAYRYSFDTHRMPFFGFRVARVLDE